MTNLYPFQRNLYRLLLHSCTIFESSTKSLPIFFLLLLIKKQSLSILVFIQLSSLTE